MILKLRYFTFLGLLLFLFTGEIHAQEPVEITRSENKIVLEGKIYYVHVVKKGQTLYSIAKAYNVSEKEIIIENPGASAELRIGQVLKIPAKPETAFHVDTGIKEDQKRQHIMKEGETIYSVSRMYQCTVEEILQMNPDVDINNIPLGKAIILPDTVTSKNDLSFDEKGFIFHKVKRGETLYSIGKYYSVPVKEIRSVNPELSWSGPRSGDVLRIPKPQTSSAEIFTRDTATYAFIEDTLVLDTLTEEPEYKYDELFDPFRGRDRSYNIAYLIPFNYKAMEPLDSVLKNYRTVAARERERENYLNEAAEPKSVLFLEFLEGSLLALDTLTDAGMKLDVHVYDTKMSMYTTRTILEKPEMKDMDLIIGPFFPFNLELVSEFARENKIPLVTPFATIDSLLQRNPYLFQVTPSYKTEFQKDAAMIARSFDSNLILVHNGDSAKLDQIKYLKDEIFKELSYFAAEESVMFKEVILPDTKTDDLVLALNPDRKNVIILPAKDEAFASIVASRLFYELQEYNIEIVGSSYWKSFDDIEIAYIHALNLTICHPYWYKYADPYYANLLKNFRKNYYKEPRAYSAMGWNYGALGYDLSLYFLSGMQKYGKRFILHMDDFSAKGTIHQFDFERVSRSGGYENKFMNYYSFDKELEVNIIELPPRPDNHQYLTPAGDDPFYFHFMERRKDTLEQDSILDSNQ